jgi:methylated-DNA-protein-cysteine methyltransferase-like protein
MAATKSKKFPKENLKPFELVYEITKKIPKGKVFTYGLISQRMNGRLSAAAVGWAMSALPEDRGQKGYTNKSVPWHRVINARGSISTKHESASLDADGRPIKLQRIMLENEGVEFRDDQSVDLSRYLWKNGIG